MKHKHADLIHAWADGAEIQFANVRGDWIDSPNPEWLDYDQYRIKPEEKKPVVRWLWATPDGCVTLHMFSDEEAKPMHYTIKLEWSRTEFPE